jgi:hypothetical protein
MITVEAVTSYSAVYPRSLMKSLFRVTGEFSLGLAFPFDAGEGLSPRFPFSLTG